MKRRKQVEDKHYWKRKFEMRVCFFCSLICHSLDKCSLGAVNLESKQEAYWKNSFFF